MIRQTKQLKYFTPVVELTNFSFDNQFFFLYLRIQLE
jgi:hypothetical protein